MAIPTCLNAGSQEGDWDSLFTGQFIGNVQYNVLKPKYIVSVQLCRLGGNILMINGEKYLMKNYIFMKASKAKPWTYAYEFGCFS